MTRGTPNVLGWWVAACRSAAAPGLVSTPLAPPIPNDSPGPGGEPERRRRFAHEFRDELGNRRPADRDFLACLLGVPPPGPPSEPALPPEARLWRALAQGEDAFDPYALIAHGEGALLPGTHDGAIEVWTEGELAALHALDRFARRQDSAGLRERIASAVRWHLAEIQPDNATNRPWAIHVFVRAGVVDGAIEALMHAQTMLHNCRVSLGHADRFSACLLEDAARALEEDEGVRRG